MDNCHSSKCRLMIFTTFLNIGRSPVSPVSVSLRVHFLEILDRHEISRGGYSQPQPPGTDPGTTWSVSGETQYQDILVVTRRVFIKIYGNRIRADLELNIDGSDWVGCAGQMENNKLCRKFLKSWVSEYLSIDIMFLLLTRRKWSFAKHHHELSVSKQNPVNYQRPPSLYFNGKCSCHGQGYQ